MATVLDVSRLRRRLLIAFLLVTALGVGVGSRFSPAAKASPEEIKAAFLTCAPSFSEAFPVIDTEQRDCMADVMFEYYEKGLNAELWEAIRITEFEAPYFYFPCHHILHRVGERAYYTYGDMAELILSNNSDVCGTAFIMGGLDAFGADEPTVEEFVEVAQACAAMHGPGFATRLRGMCEHSTGHVAWKATLSISGAAEYCATVATPFGQMACADGVMMQIYEPANGSAIRPLEEGYERADDICDDMWPELGATKAGCYGGAGYVYARPLYIADTKVRAEAEAPGVLTPEHRELLRDTAFFVVERCKGLKYEAGIDPCLRRAAWAIPGSVYWDQRLAEEICSFYEGYQDNCLVSEEPF